MDAVGWKRILTSEKLADVSTDLCATIANLIKILHIENNLANTLEAFLSCRLIPLDKNPGLRPIGVGEVLRRILEKELYLLYEMASSHQLGRYKYAQDKNLDIKLPFMLCIKYIKRSILKRFFSLMQQTHLTL